MEIFVFPSSSAAVNGKTKQLNLYNEKLNVHILLLTFVECLLCVRHIAKCFTWDPHRNPL